MVEVSRLDYIIANDMKSDFISSISHEFRSPLHGILASSEFLQDSKLEITQDELVSTIRTCGSTLLDTIDHLLDYSKINSFEKRSSTGNFSNELDHTVNVALLCESIVDGIMAARGFGGVGNSNPGVGEDYMHRHERRSSRLAYDCPVEIVLDFEQRDWDFQIQPGALRRIIMNLFANAQNYTEKGFIMVQLQIKDEDGRPSDGTLPKNLKMLSLKIIDSGRGMSKQFMERKLYTPFAQEDPFAPGIGLGLSIVRSIVTQLEGKINIRSKLGKGTEVGVLLPLKACEPRDNNKSRNAIYNAPKEDIEAANAIKMMQDIAQEKSLIIWRNTESKTDSNKNLAWNTLAAYCKTWLGFTILPDNNADMLSQADLVIKESLDDDFGVNDNVSASKISRVLFIQERHSRTGNRRIYLETPFSGAISMPVGPFRLARSILPLFLKPSSREDRGNQYMTAPALLHVTINERIANHSDNPRINTPWDTRTRTQDARNTLSSEPLPMNPHFTILNNQLGGPSTPKLPSQASLSSLPLSSHLWRSLRILAVDDNALNLLLLTRYLKKRPQDTLVTAINGAEAVDAVKRAEIGFNVVFMDISMPIMDGFEATRLIREFEREGIGERKRGRSGTTAEMNGERREGEGEWAYVVALTGLASRRDRDEADKSGFDDFLTKPVSFKIIGGILERLSRDPGAHRTSS
jgi:signal transduction histidine kinase/CheY-like chemotaxis protein